MSINRNQWNSRVNAFKDSEAYIGSEVVGALLYCNSQWILEACSIVLYESSMSET